MATLLLAVQTDTCLYRHYRLKLIYLLQLKPFPSYQE
jgi:hypothetical protein